MRGIHFGLIEFLIFGTHSLIPLKPKISLGNALDGTDNVGVFFFLAEGMWGFVGAYCIGNLASWLS